MFEPRPEYKDLSEHPLIGQLRSMVGEPDFDTLFNQLTADEDNNARFLLRMELRRVAAPCQRVIDLRQKGFKDAEPLDMDGVLHHLDAGARRIFEQGLREFNGRYTIATYEDVMRYAEQQRRERQEGRTVEEDETHWLNLVRFGTSVDRASERLHFVSAVTLAAADGQRLAAMTKDLSVQGLRLKLEAPAELAPQALLEVHWDGLNGEGNHWPPLRYRVMEQQHRELRLARVDADPAMDEHLHSLVAERQRRYKLDVKHLLETTRSRGFEQLVLGQSAMLPLFFGGEPGQWQLRQSLITTHNRALVERFRDGDDSLLPELVNSDLIQRLFDRPEEDRELFLLAFSHYQQGKRFLFAADLERLQGDGLLELFLHFGAHKPQWHLYKLSLFEVDGLNLTQLDADPLTEDQELQLSELKGDPVSQDLQAIRLVAILRDISQPRLKDYLQEPARGDPNSLVRYRLDHPRPLPTVAMRFSDMRIEPRYSYRSQVEVTLDGQRYEGVTRDISVQGLCVVLNSPLPRSPGEVDIALPKLQRLTDRFNLMRLPYQVVHHDGNEHRLHLMVADLGHTHPAKRFFSALIAANEDKLRIIEEPQSRFALARGLRQLLVSAGLPPCLFVQKREGKLSPNWLGLPVSSLPLPLLLNRLSQADQGRIDLEELLPWQQFRTLLREWKKAGVAQADNNKQLLLVALGKDGMPVLTRLQSQLPGEELIAFLEQAGHKGGWQAWLLEPSRIGKPDMHFIQKELNTISRQALHRAKLLEEDLWNTLAVVEITEVSAALACVLGLAPPR
ncbi:PilZ domain-containing protein [Gallaecimonas sp. GXIMD4217]|uniref:PilZ domain-containing protein n=1 Tax=Gallaecimonas sp. GXIMD4217 TaxID=3131927 RepID=UPI00311ACAB1